MTATKRRPDGEGPAEAAAVRADALEVVSDALQWQLPLTQWQTIEQALAAMQAAATAGDMAALVKATADLEVAGPLRIQRISATPSGAPEPRVRELLNQLVFTLGGTSASTSQQEDKDRER